MSIQLDPTAIEKLQPHSFWFIFLAITLAVIYALYQSYKSLHRARTMRDTPTAKIRSAPQGYVELEGIQRNMTGEHLKGPLTKLPCTWYQYSVEKRGNKQWVTIERGQSSSIFEINDGTGTCIINPDGAKISTDVCHRWYGFQRVPAGLPSNTFFKILSYFGSYRYIEWQMTPGMDLYAIGNFSTVRRATHPDQKHTLKDHSEEVHILSGEGLSARQPFILSGHKQNKLIKKYTFEASLWFAAFLFLFASDLWFFFARF